MVGAEADTPPLTVSIAVAEAAAYPPDAACKAVIVDVPAATTVIVEPLTVATDGLLLTYVNWPELLLAGAVSEKEGSPAVLLMGSKVPNVGAAPTTVRVAVAEPET